LNLKKYDYPQVKMLRKLNNRAGTLELIIGCMYSGKSSEFINRVRQYRILGKKTLVVNHSNDNRYSSLGYVSSHDRVQIESVSFTHAREIAEHPDYHSADVIFIEEAQFFDDLESFVEQAVDIECKHLVICGLDGDFNRKPFYNVVNLIPKADVVERKNALCVECKDGTLASFSKRVVSDESRTLVGASGVYTPVCRYHFLSRV
jgi:thymidine kinase